MPDRPGAAIAVIKDGRLVFTTVVGLADVEQGVPVTLNTNFRLASVTKHFTAMAILILVDQKRLSLDDNLSDLVSGFPGYGARITVRHLLQHTSGLLDYEDLIPAGTSTQLKDRDVVALLRRQDHGFFAPGERFRYNNSGYALLAVVVEKVSGISFGEFLERNIFEPLGMAGTVAHEEGVTVVANRAFGYTWRGGRFERTDQSLTSAVLGDGGIYSSIADLTKWDAALDANQLVGPTVLLQAFSPGRLNNGNETNYGFGWQLNTYRGLECVSHSGSTIGFRHFIARFPRKRTTLIVLTNRSNPIPSDLFDRTLEALQLTSEPAGTDAMIGRLITGSDPLDQHTAAISGSLTH